MTASFHLAMALGENVDVERFLAAFRDREAHAFVLDGAGTSRLDRWAFMGAEPVATLRATRAPERDPRGRRLTVVEQRSERGTALESRETTADALGSVRRFLATHPGPATFDARYPAPFRGGAVGYFGYECGQVIERLPGRSRPGPGMPDIALAMHRWVIAVDREARKTWLSVIGIGRDVRAAEHDATATAARVRSRLAATAKPVDAPRPRAGRDVVAKLSRDEYLARVVAAKRHIETGDAFEICLTNALHAAFDRERARDLFLELRRSNPAPFAALLDLPEGAVVSSSPERFLSLDDAGVVESRPIKGTRPRGRDELEDARLAEELLTSPKDRAENTMIVDLVRNDLGRVCRLGTVEVPELCVVESYATVHQLVSTVRGELEDGRDVVDLISAAFPPGSMTGAPKIEAMTILEHLEPVERGVYSGALGWIDAGGGADLSVVIRTAIVREGLATFSVGGAIVADSDPAAEHEETMHKARALVVAITGAP